MQNKISEKLNEDSSKFQEIQVSQIEDKLKKEIDRKRKLERQLIVLNEQLRCKKQCEYLEKLKGFIRTE